MKNRRKLAMSSALVVIVGTSIGLAAVVHAGPFAERPRQTSSVPPDRGPVIATVDGSPIYLSEMQSRVQGIQQVHGDFERIFGKDWQQTLLQNLVDDKIIEQQASAMGIDVTDEQVQRHVDELRSGFPTQDQFQSWLRQGQMTESELAQRIRLQTLATDVYLKVTSDITVSRDQLHAYYERHQAEYPGLDGQGAPFLAVKDDIRRKVEKRLKDAAYARWLDSERTATRVVVVMPNWWKEIS